ncbi:hypothetical protein AB6A40_006370 [Gnathostoma spinigerum]|uniref:Uncharacterized protein n=1 Tax=Gnathostoma spinigerum TaxID=75299 RepID=A0ABD6EQF9_9BILA
MKRELNQRKSVFGEELLDEVCSNIGKGDKGQRSNRILLERRQQEAGVYRPSEHMMSFRVMNLKNKPTGNILSNEAQQTTSEVRS